MTTSDKREVIDAILSKAGQSFDQPTQDELSELHTFCCSVNDALGVYSVKGVDVNHIIEDGFPKDILAFKQKCRAILDQLKEASSPDEAIRDARIALSCLTNEVREEISSRFLVSSQTCGETDFEGHAIDVDFFADGFIVRDADKKECATASAVVLDLDSHPSMLNWKELSVSERAQHDLPAVPKLEALRCYNMGQHQSFLNEIKQGILPKECQKQLKGRPLPTTVFVHDYRPKCFAELREVVANLTRMHEQQTRDRKDLAQEAERKRKEAEQEAERKREQVEQEAERKKRQDWLLSLEKTSQPQLSESEDREVAAHADVEAKDAEEKQTYAVVSALVALRNKYKETDHAGLVTCLTTLQTYIKNLSSNPGEPKFRHINMENSGFKKRVSAFEGASSVLLACGFREESSAFVFGGDTTRSTDTALHDALRKIDILLDQLKR